MDAHAGMGGVEHQQQPGAVMTPSKPRQVRKTVEVGRPRWRSAKTPPDSSRFVLLLRDNGMCEIGWFAASHWFAARAGQMPGVTHWLPLPKPPRVSPPRKRGK